MPRRARKPRKSGPSCAAAAASGLSRRSSRPKFGGMDHAVILISVFAVFIPALLLPGPDFVAVVRSSMTHGTRAGLLTTIGVSTGLCLYATLSLVGLSAIL